MMKGTNTSKSRRWVLFAVVLIFLLSACAAERIRPLMLEVDRPSRQKRRKVGKARSVGLLIALSIATFGIWTFLWSFWIGEELQRYSDDGVRDFRL